MKNNSPLLTFLLVTLLASCTPTPVQPPSPPDLTGLLNKCNTSSCTPEEETQIKAGITLDLPNTLSGDDTPELKLKGYTGPVTWTLEGPGALFGPGITWTLEACPPQLLLPGEACAYSGADRWLYFPPWQGAASTPITLRVQAGKFAFERTVEVISGTLEADERHALQFMNHIRAIPHFCANYDGPSQPSGMPFRWDNRLKQAAQKKVAAPKILSNEEVIALAEQAGYHAKALARGGTVTISGVAGGGVSAPPTVEPDRLYQDARRSGQLAANKCAEFHDPVYRDFAASVGMSSSGYLNSGLLGSYE